MTWLSCLLWLLIAAPAAFAVTPVVRTIAPNNGPAVGGSAVTVEGSAFTPGSTVMFGAAASTDVKVESSDAITAVSPPGSGTVDVTVSNTHGTSPVLASGQFGYDPTPTGAWLGLDGNSAAVWPGRLSDFTVHNVLYDRGGDPGIDWQAGEPLEARGTPTAGGRALARSIAAGMTPDVTIEYRGYHGDLRSDPSFPTSSGQIAAYVDGFITSARAIHRRYPGAIFEAMNEPWGYTTPRDDGAKYADVIARLLPAAAAAGIPLQQIYVAAYGPDASASAEQIGGWVPAMYEAQPQLQKEIAGWYFHPYGPPEGNEFEPGIRSVREVQRLMTSGQNNIIVSEIGFCALDVSRAPDCLGHAEAPDGTRAAALLTRTLDVALSYRDAGWLRALIVYARADGGWSMQTSQGRLTAQGEALDAFADLHGSAWSSMSAAKPLGDGHLGF